MDKQEEQSIFKRFREIYNQLPPGKIEYIDKPDVVFTCDFTEYKIGIEITETFHSQASKEMASSRNKFVDDVIYKIRKSINYGFYLDIDFSVLFDRLKQKDKERIKEEIFQICIEKLSILNDKEEIRIGNFYFGEKTELDEIEGVNEITLGKWIDSMPWNVSSEGGPVPNFSDTHLDIILNKKNNSLKEYSICDEYWLIIKEGDYYVGSFKNFLIIKPIVSRFDKIFIYRQLEDKIIQLK